MSFLGEVATGNFVLGTLSKDLGKQTLQFIKVDSGFKDSLVAAYSIEHRGDEGKFKPLDQLLDTGFLAVDTF